MTEPPAPDGQANPLITLVLGGARSGKSRRAENLVRGYGLSPVYVATAQGLDEEMAHRIAVHRGDRSEDWRTIEEPLAIDTVIAREARPGQAVLVDCLTLWLTNVMHAPEDWGTKGDVGHPDHPDPDDHALADAQARLLSALAEARGPVVLVSNEVGLGLVPETPLGRAFRDAQGRLNQAVAAMSGQVEFMVAGLPMTVKGRTF